MYFFCCASPFFYFARRHSINREFECFCSLFVESLKELYRLRLITHNFRFIAENVVIFCGLKNGFLFIMAIVYRLRYVHCTANDNDLAFFTVEKSI